MARARKGQTRQSKNKGNQKKNLKRIKTTQEVLSNLKK